MSLHDKPVSAIAGWLMLSMIFLTLGRDVLGLSSPWALWVCGLPGWLAAIILIGHVSGAQRWQTGIIAIAGLGLMALAARQGSSPDFAAAIGNNADLISMIASVGFLRLIATPETGSENLPVGGRAFFSTILGVSLFGAVINISAPILFADRLSVSGALTRLASQSITRVFSGCSAWSPFFGGMAVVVTYVPGLELRFVIACCLPFAIVGFVVVYSEALLRFRSQLMVFRGYPVQFSSLWVPGALAVLVFLLSQLAGNWSVLSCISISALVLTGVLLAIRHGLSAMGVALCQQVTVNMPRMVNELLLFLVAGVLAAGLASVISGGLLSVAGVDFHWKESAYLVGGMILLSIVGIHPVVTVSGATPLIATLGPNSNLLAVAYLLAWSLGTSASPLSGTHLVFQGRYSIPSWRGAMWNWPYVAIMFLVAIPLLYMVDMVVS